jgi:hypothetical protein
MVLLLLLDASTPADPRPRLDSARQKGGGGWSLTRTPTCMHPFSAEVTFGAKSYEEYMCQFMFGEVKFKDFHKANIPKFHAVLFHMSTMGVWCPP